VPNTVWIRPEFVKELLWRRHVYNNAVQSMREVFRREVREETSGNEEYDEVKRLEGEEFEQILARNSERNRVMAERRYSWDGVVSCVIIFNGGYCRVQRLETGYEEVRAKARAELEEIRRTEAVEDEKRTMEVEELIVSPIIPLSQ